jgi:hypothetical protein
MGIEIANAHIDLAIENATDKRVKTTLDNIKKAANILYGQKDEISTTTVGEYCEEHFGKPSTQTLFNDKNDLYKPCISEFERLNRGKKKHNEVTKIMDTGVNKGAAIEIGNLRNRVKLLENLLQKQFKIADDMGLISIDEIITSTPTASDTVNMDIVKTAITEIQKDAIQTIMNTLLERCDDIEITGKNNGKRITDLGTGESLLNPRELAALTSLLSGEK